MEWVVDYVAVFNKQPNLWQGREPLPQVFNQSFRNHRKLQVLAHFEYSFLKHTLTLTTAAK